MSAFTFWALGTLLKGTLLLVLALAIAAALRHSSAAVRHLVWGTGLAMLLALPLASLLPWRLPLIGVASLVQTAPPPLTQTHVTQQNPAEPTQTQAAPAAPQPQTGASAAATSSPGMTVSLSPASLLSIALAIWAIGMVWLIGRLVIGAVLLRRVVRKGTALDNSEWRHPLLEAADRLALERLPRLVMSDRLPMPFACGVLQPAIVLPTGAAEWDDRRRRAVLFHELAHLSRYDLIGNALGQLACAVYWFHPLVWVAARKLRVESERAADDLVLGVGTRASEYADHLLQIVCRAARSRTPAIALPMAQRHEFEGRMLAILEREARREPASSRHAVMLGALALSLVLPLAALAPAGTKAPAESVVSSVVRDSVAPRSQPPPQPNQAPVAVPAPSRKPAAPATVTGMTGTTALQGADSNAVIAALKRALEDSAASVRENAAYALGHLESAAAVPVLIARLPHDPAPSVREMICWALGQIESHAATEVLASTALHDGAPDVRAMAVWALGQVQDAAAVPALEQVLHDGAPEVRGRAAWALGTIAPAKAPSGLIAALSDGAPGVRMRAAWALGQIGDSSAAARLAVAIRDSSSEVRKAAMWAVAQVGGEAAQAVLIEALSDKDPEIRARAARSLSGSHADPWPWPWPMPIIR
ncbi:MAG TPA: M56 family metallopeptidase [Gemmatimonadales bacterium]|nr:M56 family metallopeptidase [Gemmatimonadales bacterium]